MFARYRYDALHGAPTPTPAVPTIAPLGPGRAVEPDLTRSREARCCWPVLAAWAVVPLDQVQIMLVDAAEAELARLQGRSAPAVPAPTAGGAQGMTSNVRTLLEHLC